MTPDPKYFCTYNGPLWGAG